MYCTNQLLVFQAQVHFLIFSAKQTIEGNSEKKLYIWERLQIRLYSLPSRPLMQREILKDAKHKQVNVEKIKKMAKSDINKSR